MRSKVHVPFSIVNIEAHLDFIKFIERKVELAQIYISTIERATGRRIGDAGYLPVAMPANGKIHMVNRRVTGVSRIGICCKMEHIFDPLSVLWFDPYPTRKTGL
jgi:hypothetical protein